MSGYTIDWIENLPNDEEHIGTTIWVANKQDLSLSLHQLIMEGERKGATSWVFTIAKAK